MSKLRNVFLVKYLLISQLAFCGSVIKVLNVSLNSYIKTSSACSYFRLIHVAAHAVDATVLLHLFLRSPADMTSPELRRYSR